MGYASRDISHLIHQARGNVKVRNEYSHEYLISQDCLSHNRYIERQDALLKLTNLILVMVSHLLLYIDCE